MKFGFPIVEKIGTSKNRIGQGGNDGVEREGKDE